MCSEEGGAGFSMWGEGGSACHASRFQACATGPHARSTLPSLHQVWCLGTGEGPDGLRKKVEQDQHVG